MCVFHPYSAKLHANLSDAVDLHCDDPQWDVLVYSPWSDCEVDSVQFRGGVLCYFIFSYVLRKPHKIFKTQTALNLTGFYNFMWLLLNRLHLEFNFENCSNSKLPICIKNVEFVNWACIHILFPLMCFQRMVSCNIRRICIDTPRLCNIWKLFVPNCFRNGWLTVLYIYLWGIFV